MYYGFDIGGSKIALGIYDQQRQLQWSRRVPTPCDNYEQLLQVLETLTREADQFTGEAGTVGIGLPGRIDSRSGTLLSVNIPAVCGRALGQDLTQRLAREVRLDNDANCFTLSEAWDAEFQRYPVVAGIILGTGVGGGIVIEGKPVAGCHAVAGEFGHLRLPVDALDIVGTGIPLLPCGCGKSGCIEPYLSGPGFARLFQLWYGESLSVPAIIARYTQGDPLARAHTARYQSLLAVCLGSLLTLLDPHLVVFGGGLSNFTALYDGLTERVADVLLPGVCPPRFSPARHGDAGGMRGAAFLHLR